MRISELQRILPLELFEGSNVLDFQDGRYLVANRAMESATIYTIDLKSDFIRNHNDVFSFDGPFLSALVSENSYEAAELSLDSIDSLDEESNILEQKFNNMLPRECVLKVHNKLCYLDFVSIITCTGYSEPIVVSGGRDHHVYISTFRSHQIIADIVDDDDWKAIPRCGAWDGHRYFYVGCDNGVIISIDMKDPEHNTRRHYIGGAGFKYISASEDGRTIAAFNRDNVLLQMSIPDMEAIVADEIEDNVLDIFAMGAGNPVLVIAQHGSGDRFYMQIAD